MVDSSSGVAAGADPARVQVILPRGPTPVWLEDRGPRRSEGEIAAFEARIGYPLPADYREFLLRYNGGSPVVGDVVGRDDTDAPYEHGDAVRTFLALPRRVDGPDPEVPGYARLELPEEHPWQTPRNILQIGDDAGGNAFMLDLKSGLVTFWDHASNRPPEDRRVLGDDFFDFLCRFVTLEERAARDAAEKEAERLAIEEGPMPAGVEAYCEQLKGRFPHIRTWVRAACVRVFHEKGYFALHADEASRHVFDLACWLRQATTGKPIDPKVLGDELMTAWSPTRGGFGLGGYAPRFVEDWFADRVARGTLVVARWSLRRRESGARLTDAAIAELVARCGG
ncbi:SMI1/KNR4 family protein [Pendulispora albinea]|uniref:SMI1/KNR4 family protein n=1 Tax=Pendulispora albinea TaxID=2741071 RepID=A0ABZ2LZ69_9BACT